MKAPEKAIEGIQNLSSIQQEIVEKLAYFGVFKHPLRASEIQNLLHNYYSYPRVCNALESLQNDGLCYEFDGYFLLAESIEEAIKTRHANENNAAIFLAKLPLYVRIISAFPYVRGIAVSGSLSKGVLHADGDIDYFIVTAHNRLWLARVLLIAFKKLVLFNSHRYFCVNYFVSEKHLEIPDKNLFTATEISTLIPVFGFDVLADFKRANNWVGNFYGHFEHPIVFDDLPPKKRPIKTSIEWLLNNALGNALDVLFMYITMWRWDVKFKHFDRSKFNLTLRSTRNVSKHHPQDFQTTVLQRVEEIKARLATKISVQK